MGLKRFDFKLKDNSKKNSIIVASIIVLVLLIGVTIYATYAAYKVTNTYNIIQGKVAEFENVDIKINVIAVDNEGNETTVEEFPTEGYVFDYLKSKCENGSEIEFNEESQTASITSTGKDSCSLYFRKYGALADAIIKSSEIVLENPNFSTAATDENTKLYLAEDDYGTSYYLRGASTNNYVQLGEYQSDVKRVRGYYSEDSTTYYREYDTMDDCNNSDIFNYNCTEVTYATKGNPMYWRIVRINGDGSVRLIYDGINKVQNGEIHIASIGSSDLGQYEGDSKYLGYTYDDGNGKQVDSTFKTYIDNWYKTHLKSTYESNISDSIFCNDRSLGNNPYPLEGHVDYAAEDRLNPDNGVEDEHYPILTCPNKSDRYTVNDTTNGNGFLTNPIGLLTADESFFAGGTQIENYNYYLYSGYDTMTLTPLYYNGTVGVPGAICNNGLVPGLCEGEVYAIRPVINLNGDVKFEGNGSFETPYIISE